MVERLVANEKVEGSTPFARSIRNKIMIIWIASYPKSGNTYVRSFLSSYYYSKKGTFDFELLLNIKQFPAFRYSSKKAYTYLDAASNWIPNQNSFFKKDENCFLKTHNSLEEYFGKKFTTSAETAGGIYIVRDPRNIISSLCNHYAIDLDKAYTKMTDHNSSLSLKLADEDYSNFTFLGTWSNHYWSWKNNMNFKTLIIRYEDLRDNTHEEFRKILNFIENLKGTNNIINEEKLTNSINSTNFSKLKNKEKMYGFGESTVSKDGKPINFFNLGFRNKWEELLPKKMSDKIRDEFNNELKDLKYE